MLQFILSALFWSAVVLAIVAVCLGFCFVNVKEGTAKIVVRFGGYRKTLLAKKGYSLDGNGNVVVGQDSCYPAFMGGLRWVGILKPFGIDKIYLPTIRFIKALPNGDFERHEDAVDFILAGTQYQYGLEFSAAEDKEKLPLHGKMTLTAMIINPYKALFLVKNWFDAMISRVLPKVREFISEHSYDEIIKDPRQLDSVVFAALSSGTTTQPSIISILRDQYGIELLALETVNIDPPEGYREATLAKWKAQQTADKDVEETAGRIRKSVAITAGLTIEELAQRLRENPKLPGIPRAKGGLKEDFELAWDQLKRDRAGSGLRDLRVGNADGTNLDPVTAWVVGLLGLLKSSADSGGSGGAKDGKSGSKKHKNPKDMTPEDGMDETFGG